ncbi:MAG: lipoprotein NlpD [Paraglaciecola sp.]|jgi:lipoprotein NlpD
MLKNVLLVKASELVVVLTLFLNLSACSTRSTPAPVTELYQGKTYRDFAQEGFSGSSYTVQKGDTLYSVAWYTGKDYQDIAKTNNIAAPYNIFPGQRLTLKAALPSSIELKPKTQAARASRINPNQAVDRLKKQAYSKKENIVSTGSIEPIVSKFPKHISSWHWPSKNKVIRGFSAKDQGNKGLDFAGKIGSAVLAAADGKVVYTGSALRGFGKLIIVKHSDAYLSAYAHNNQILVKEQQWIKAGQNIASMGRSGTDMVKLHFEVRYKGKSIDPLRYLPKR